MVLGCDVVAPTGHNEGGVLSGALAETGQRGDHAIADELEASSHLELFDVLGEIPGGHPCMDQLVPGQRRELLDARLHIVAGDALALLDALEIDLVDHRDVVIDGCRRHGNPEVGLGAHDGHPELAFEHHLVLGRPDLDHRCAGVTGGQHVGEVRSRHRRHPPTQGSAAPT